MKILFITEFFPVDDKLIFSGGVEAYGYYLVKELSKKNKVIVISQVESNDKSQSIDIKGIKPLFKKFDTSILTIPSRIYFLFQVIRIGLRIDFDIVQGNNFVTYPAAFLLGFIRKKPTVAWYPDVFIGRWAKLTNLFSGLIGELSERLSILFPWNQYIALSNSTKEKLIKLSIPESKIKTIYAGIDSHFFNSKNNKKNKIFTICCIARLVKYKNIDILIQAAKLLIDQGEEINVNIIGKGPDEKRLKKLIKKLNLQNYIFIEKDLSREELVIRLKRSSLFCLPSSVEGFGMVVIEAASCGVPYLVSNISVLKEITKNGIGGLFFKNGNIKDLAKQIVSFKENSQLQKKLIENTKLLVENYRWDYIAQEFENVYKDLLVKDINILMLNEAWFPHIGGGQIHNLELAKRLIEQDFTITIFTRNMGEWNEKLDKINVIRKGFIKKFGNIFGRLEYLTRALYYVLTANYDILHIYAFSPGLLVPIVKFYRKEPIIYTVLGDGLKIAGLPFGEKLLQDLVFYKISYDAEITVSRNSIKQKTKSQKNFYIPNGVDIKHFSEAIRKRTKIKKIVCIARLYKDKGVDLLIEAFKNLDNRIVELIIIGDGPERNNLQLLSKNCKNISFRDVLLGRKYLKILAEADLMVIPSRTEGLPLRLLEAWAAKLPVVATNVGDIPNFIEDGKNGFLATPDVKSITSSLNQAISSKNLIQISDQGFIDVQKYDWLNISRMTAKVYKEILSEKA